MEVSNPRILDDNRRLEEIYRLRVLAYEHSFKAEYVNRDIFPNGWKDGLDERAIHWIIESGGNIIASSRLVLLNDLKETAEDLDEFNLPAGRPFGYFSRLVVHPDFRGNGISKIMDKSRMSYIKDNKVPFTLAFSFADRAVSLIELGFKELGSVSYRWCGEPLPSVQQHLFIFKIVDSTT
jgi:predicted GNAT family N-acyltransferase